MKALTSAATTAHSVFYGTHKFASKDISANFSGFATPSGCRREIQVSSVKYLFSQNINGYNGLLFSQSEFIDMLRHVIAKQFLVKPTAVQAIYNPACGDRFVNTPDINYQQIRFFIEHETDGGKLVEDVMELSIAGLTNSECTVILQPKRRILGRFVGGDGKANKYPVRNTGEASDWIELEGSQAIPFEITIS